jgi:hypothetical protein
MGAEREGRDNNSSRETPDTKDNRLTYSMRVSGKDLCQSKAIYKVKSP